jgi:hypothetical protein
MEYSESFMTMEICSVVKFDKEKAFSKIATWRRGRRRTGRLEAYPTSPAVVAS